MKNINYFLILISFVFVFNACEESGFFFPSNSNSQGDGIFEVTFDGQLFSTQNVSFTSDGTDMYINAIKPETDEVFTLRVNNFDVGVFGFEGTNTVATYIKNDPVSADIWTTVDNSLGNIEFKDIDFGNNSVSGTFNFVA